MTWYTITVLGTPVEGSTNDKTEALEILELANKPDAFDGMATITETDKPLAN
jgi:hypothetical protein